MDELPEEKTLARAVPESAEIKNLIYVVRGKQVMLDSDLAMLYQVETRRINENVKRNSARFPKSFCFQLTKEEYDGLMSQIATSSSDGQHGGRRKLPRVFTEQGVAMLSAVLRSDTAVAVSVRIMETFVEMRRFIADNAEMFARVGELESWRHETDKRLDFVFDFIEEREAPAQKVFFGGQIYDAFSLLVDLIRKAKREIVLVDGYVDTGTLNILAKKNERVAVAVYTKSGRRPSQGDIDAFNAQYPPLEVHRTDAFHDRFLIIDGETAYHIGASLKDAGKKAFALTLIEDGETVENIKARLEGAVD